MNKDIETINLTLLTQIGHQKVKVSSSMNTKQFSAAIWKGQQRFRFNYSKISIPMSKLLKTNLDFQIFSQIFLEQPITVVVYKMYDIFTTLNLFRVSIFDLLQVIELQQSVGCRLCCCYLVTRSNSTAKHDQQLDFQGGEPLILHSDCFS